jgi:N-acyl-D-aspartate/D-glutamate deacylase
MALMAALATSTGRPLSMTVQQPEELPDRWREMGAWVDAEVERGAPLKTQVAVRPIGILQGLTATAHPLMICPSFQEIMFRPLPEIVRALQEPDRRSRLVAEHADAVTKLDGLALDIFGSFHKIFPMENPVDYEPKASDSIAARAAAVGRPVVEFLIDLLCEDDGNKLLYKPLFNFSHGNLDDVREMLLRKNAVLGLSDAGAHCGAICDGSMSTTALALWTRDRHEEGRLPVELMVHHLTQRTASHVGWLDRGVVAPGYLADLNVIDMATLAAAPPRIVHDLPAGGRRLMQTASGYVHTVKRGVVTFSGGQHTGDLPGRLVRGAQPAPR